MKNMNNDYRIIKICFSTPLGYKIYTFKGIKKWSHFNGETIFYNSDDEGIAYFDTSAVVGIWYPEYEDQCLD